MSKLYLLTRAEERDICTSCPLTACVTPADKRCPARKADRRKRSQYRKERRVQLRADWEARRGYWPDGYQFSTNNV
jgi:hypothetical protein